MVFSLTPLSPEEFERAISVPAAAVGVSRFERGLLAEIVADVSGEPGALPLSMELVELNSVKGESTLASRCRSWFECWRDGKARSAAECGGPEDGDSPEGARLRCDLHRRRRPLPGLPA